MLKEQIKDMVYATSPAAEPADKAVMENKRQEAYFRNPKDNLNYMDNLQKKIQVDLRLLQEAFTRIRDNLLDFEGSEAAYEVKADLRSERERARAMRLQAKAAQEEAKRKARTAELEAAQKAADTIFTKPTAFPQQDFRPKQKKVIVENSEEEGEDLGTSDADEKDRQEDLKIGAERGEMPYSMADLQKGFEMFMQSRPMAPATPSPCVSPCVPPFVPATPSAPFAPRGGILRQLCPSTPPRPRSRRAAPRGSTPPRRLPPPVRLSLPSPSAVDI
jgi:hypothetical protein